MSTITIVFGLMAIVATCNKESPAYSEFMSWLFCILSLSFALLNLIF